MDYSVGESEGAVTLHIDVASGELMQEVEVRLFTESSSASGRSQLEASYATVD